MQWTVLPHGVPARAIDGNMLEAINVTLNIFDKHYMDRDLYRAGQGIVMITAGCSVYKAALSLFPSPSLSLSRFGSASRRSPSSA